MRLTSAKNKIFFMYILYFLLVTVWIYIANTYGFFISNNQLSSSNIGRKLMFDITILSITCTLVWIYRYRYVNKNRLKLQKPKLLLCIVIGYLLLLAGVVYKRGLNLVTLYLVFYYLIVVAFCEELFFRYFYYGQLKEFYNDNIAIIISGTCWGIMHTIVPAITSASSVSFLVFSNIIGFIMVSKVYVEIYKYTGSLLSVILIHAGLDTLLCF